MFHRKARNVSFTTSFCQDSDAERWLRPWRRRQEGNKDEDQTRFLNIDENNTIGVT